ncbi:MAG: hypothetical protein M3436_17635 [Pseudomonadota bacterium]|nr:hypothetical protein [Pseudomonadota bacterium]
MAILYGGGIFACRHCYRLAYESQREAARDRAIRRARKIYARLSGDPNCLGMPDKPKWMHWRTYQRLSAEAEGAELRSWAGTAERFGLLRDITA